VNDHKGKETRYGYDPVGNVTAIGYPDGGQVDNYNSLTEIELIPSKLHGNVPHVGSASDLRLLRSAVNTNSSSNNNTGIFTTTVILTVAAPQANINIKRE